MRGTRFEVSTRSIDRTLQGIGGDPYGGLYSTGIPVPLLPPADSSFKNRYLFQLVRAQFNAHEKFRLVGMRQMVKIGLVQPSNPLDPDSCGYPLYLNVQTPDWHFVDGNISWHLRRVNSLNVNDRKPSGVPVGDSEAYLYSYGTPALLLKTAAGDGDGYVPPNSGQPWGQQLNGLEDLGTFSDIRFPWDRDIDHKIDCEIEGPCDIVLFASVQQSDFEERCQLFGGSPPEGYDLGSLGPEDRFVLANPGAVYARIAGSLIFETADMIGTPAPMREAPLPPGITP